MILSQAQIEQLFTMTFTIDSEMVILHSSEALQKRCPEALPGKHLLSVFYIHRPRGLKSYAEIVERQNTLFLLISKDRRFALRGQIVTPEQGNTDVSYFMGSPWMSWLSENCPDIGLSMTEYPRHDSQLDHQFYIVTQQAMVKDLEVVNMEARLARDEAQQARQIQSDFFAVMSHEMRTPLNGVISALDLMQDEKSPGSKTQLLSVANSSAKNLLSVINYVLDFSKLQSGRLKNEDEVFELGTLLYSVIDIVKSKAEEKGVNLCIDVSPDCPEVLIADGSKIRQILLNLVSNAVKFTDQGKVAVRVGGKVLEKSGRYLLSVEVEDSGIGISEEQRPFIFDAFWTSRERTARGESNTGLGLNICRRMADLIGGKLSYTSTPGVGTCFHFELDVGISQITLQGDAPKAPVHLIKKGRVLLVDDNQTNLLVGTLMLERMGLRVQIANDGTEAVKMQASHRFDLILMDITMTTMGGVEATRLIRESGDLVPIIALTAHIGEERDQSYIKSGMQDVVHKPIEKPELINVLNRWLPESDNCLELQSENVSCTSKDVSSDSADTEEVWIDESIVKTLKEDIGDENFNTALAVLTRDTVTRMNKLRSAWKEQDSTVVANEAHTLSSSLSCFGATRAGQIMRQLEHAANGDDHELVEQKYIQAESIFEPSLLALQAMLNNVQVSGLE